MCESSTQRHKAIQRQQYFNFEVSTAPHSQSSSDQEAEPQKGQTYATYDPSRDDNQRFA